MNNVHVIVLAYALVNELNNLLRLVDRPGVTTHLFLHSCKAQVAEICELRARSPRVVYYPYGTNRGLGKSVNEGILNALNAKAETIIVPNDDVLMSEFDFGRLVQGCLDNPDVGLVFANGDDGQSLAFHVFGFNRRAMDVTGAFDESFPDYFCDTDYLRRCALLGVRTVNIGDTGIVHLGSGTKTADPLVQKRLNATYPLDEAWYVNKHGGVPGSETYVFPWNDPALSWRIRPDWRDNPYSAHQRLGLVP